MNGYFNGVKLNLEKCCNLFECRQGRSFNEKFNHYDSQIICLKETHLDRNEFRTRLLLHRFGCSKVGPIL